MRSHREVAREAEVRAVAAKEDPPGGGCVEEGCGERGFLWEKAKGMRVRGRGRRGWEDRSFSFREGRKGKRAGLRSHREVVGEAEVRAVAAKEDPPTGDARKERRGEGG